MGEKGRVNSYTTMCIHVYVVRRKLKCSQVLFFFSRMFVNFFVARHECCCFFVANSFQIQPFHKGLAIQADVAFCTTRMFGNTFVAVSASAAMRARPRPRAVGLERRRRRPKRLQAIIGSRSAPKKNWR
jgi:hypothetical protein